ncbi:AMP-binding protein [Aeromicrobium fastidiosum]|uniref:Long-chain fatty acid--CoA ligase n=1 Tax=Aeromicrobium fastidiosum TaxID=52699 RepID=A0A641APG8_9ACTN|nr:AMP-binding protein [Aeromicrobium fastidiosum]KAA1376529.1 long-chain fatty acid--CoA ligase [Aeromicrobium fastidiosum]MBP2391554.1 acyl-CoA synthetase (AMP-forming)/AMP-acid ligase II [Aeromicrobium fastidiosum]
MTSLVFRILDWHVVSGLADDLAVSDARGTVSYAQLLHESACIAAGLRHMGVEPGTPVVLDGLHGRDLVTSVLACARIGAVPADTAAFRLAGTPPVLHAPSTEVTWDVLDKAGRTEPAAAPEHDDEGYEEHLRTTYKDIIETLERGGTITEV